MIVWFSGLFPTALLQNRVDPNFGASSRASHSGLASPRRCAASLGGLPAEGHDSGGAVTILRVKQSTKKNHGECHKTIPQINHK